MPKLRDQVREATRRLHYSIRTEDAYVDWTKRFILFHGKKHPLEMGEPDVVTFLTHLAVHRNLAASTRNQALCALLFLYKVVPGRPLAGIDDGAVRAKTPERLPTVFSRQEARAVLAPLDGTAWLAASLLYGAGLRLMECLRLRVKDVDFDQVQLIVRDGKGQKDRATILPTSSAEPLRRQIEHVRAIHEADLRDGYGRVYLPHALAEKYPHADRHLGWQYLFPSSRRAAEPAPESSDDTTSPSRPCRKPSRVRFGPPVSSSTPVVIHSGIASRPTSSSPGTISAPFRNSSATRMSAPP